MPADDRRSPDARKKEGIVSIWKVRVTGTINDLVEVEAPADADPVAVEEQARMEWRYVEFEALAAEVEDEPEDDS